MTVKTIMTRGFYNFFYKKHPQYFGITKNILTFATANKK